VLFGLENQKKALLEINPDFDNNEIEQKKKRKEERKELPEFQKVHENNPKVQILCLQTHPDTFGMSGLTYPILSSKGKAPFSFRVCQQTNGLKQRFDSSRGQINNFIGGDIIHHFYGANGLPTTFVIDERQIIRNVLEGGRNAQELEEIIRKIN